MGILLGMEKGIRPHRSYVLVQRIFILCAVLLAWRGAAVAQNASAGNLDAVLAQMDAAAQKFHSAQADFQWDQYEMVVQNTDMQKGIIYFQRSGGATQMAAQVKQFNGQPDEKNVVYRDGVLQFYQPKIAQMTIFHAGHNQQQFESFLTLGFGGSGSDLRKNWNITDEGTETIDGVKTVKLDLAAKQASVQNMFTHVTVWIDPTRSVSLKQQFFEPSGDFRTAFYRNIRYNQRVSPAVFHIKTPSKTTVIQK